MQRIDQFAYACHRCGACCRDQVITLSPYDVIRIARAVGITSGEARQRYTIRRGSILKFTDDGACIALDGAHCSIHPGRPLACRLYPLGMQHDGRDSATFVQLAPAPGSRGIYGRDGTVGSFLEAQRVGDYLLAIEPYAALLPLIRARIAALVDFATIEPREFWRCAVREALAETGYDPNPLIDALFDPDSRPGSSRCEGLVETVVSHTHALEVLIRRATEPSELAAAGVLLAVSLGYPPSTARAP